MKKSLVLAGCLILLLMQVGFSRSITGTINHDDLKRSYIIHFPEDKDVDTPMPLLIALHGAGSNGADFERLTGFDHLADHERFVVVYPDSTSSRGRQWNSMWNWGREPDDSGFLSELIDSLVNQYSLDQNKVFVTGHSVGAFMAYRLANEYPDKIAAIAANGGLVGIKELKAGSPVSILHIHGKDDSRIHLTGMPQYSYPSVEAGLGWWVERNNCSTVPETSRMNKNITVKKWKATGGVGDVVLYLIDGFGHDWPKLTNAAGIDASAVIWEFFQNHPKSSCKPTANSILWTETAELPLPISPSDVCTVNGKIYLIGGRQNAIQKDVDLTLEYNPQTDKWTTKKNYPFRVTFTE